MPKKEFRLVQDQEIPVGYGPLVGVTAFGAREVLMWFEDTSGVVRVVRMGCDTSNGLALQMKGQAQVVRA